MAYSSKQQHISNLHVYGGGLISFLRSLARLYSLSIVRSVVVALRTHDNSLGEYLDWFWHSRTFRTTGRVQPTDKPLVVLLGSVALAQIISGIYVLIDWARFGTTGGWAFGLALLVSYPVVIAHLFALGIAVRRLCYYLAHPKKLGKFVVAYFLERQVKRLRRKHHFTVVAVAGSVGKTSTKAAIAQLLGQNLRVRYQQGNYNDSTTVPLIFFGQTQPNIFNVFAWARIFGENTARIEHPYPYDVVVVELGTDGPGQMKQFAYLKPDITVLTAITPEHMVEFGTVDAVAAEELEIFRYSKRVLVNGDDVPGKHLVGRDFEEYSTRTNVAHNYYAKRSKSNLRGQNLALEFPSGTIDIHTQFVGEQGARIALAAAATADMLGMDKNVIAENMQKLDPMPGRMQILDGQKRSVIIDDSYNASPEPIMRALDVLYSSKAPQRIAVLGSMNELGRFSKPAHQAVGAYCDPQKLDMVVTIGVTARRWLAPVARAAGCQVHTFTDPQKAGEFVRKHLKEKAVVLVKGSQNGVFSEETIKPLLAHPADAEKLVRQSRYWLRVKAKQFKDIEL